MDVTYESHLSIKINKLCPFKLLQSEKAGIGLCNWHKNLEIILVASGEGEAQYGGESFKITAGDIIAVNSEAIHRFSYENGLVFVGAIIDANFCSENGIDAQSQAFVHRFRDETTRRIILKLTDLLARYEIKRTDFCAAKIRSAVLELLIDLVENHSVSYSAEIKTKRPSEKYIKDILEYLTLHCMESPSLDYLASLLGITRFHLAREFKRYTGETVFTYINTLKCKNAQVRLASGMSVTETALECGFESVSYFSRIYKKIMGHNPSKAKTSDADA